MKLNPNAFGLACGLIWGILIAAMTLTNLWWGYPSSLVNLIGDVYRWGYSTSYIGVLVGLIYGFADGYIGGAIFVLLYNKLIKK